MSKLIEERIRGNLRSAITLEFLKNSFHFPLAIILIELVLEGPADYLKSLDFFIAITAALIQAYFLGKWTFLGTPRPFIGNLIGPLLYSVAEILAGTATLFFSMPFHYAYWGFSIAIGLIQQSRLRLDIEKQWWLIIFENIVRSGILAAMYWFIEVLTEPKYADVTFFFTNKSHLFILSALLFISIIVGMDDARSQRFLHILRDTTEQLKTFSNWLLGNDMLSLALTDPSSLSLVRRERTVVFMDIRGFTQWSEHQEPEVVVNMLNRYYAVADMALHPSSVIMLKYTADEVMAFFADEGEAAIASYRMHLECTAALAEYGLAVGTGMHAGLVIEGLLGSADLKRYEIIGDTVNTAKRICTAAEAGEFLISSGMLSKTADLFSLLETRKIIAKGKSDPLEVCLVSRSQI